MKKFKLLFAVCVYLIGLCITNNAFAQTQPPTQTVTKTVNFEEFAASINADGSANNSTHGWSWNGTSGRNYTGLFPNNFLTSTGNDIYLPAFDLELGEYSYSSKEANFYWSGWDGQDMNFWCGTGLSTVTDTTYNGFMNEMVSVTGSGNGGSTTYAVVYGDCMNDLPYDESTAIRISLPSGAVVKSIAITNTVYTAASLNGGLEDSDFSVHSPPITQEGDTFGINIYGLDSAGNLVNTIQVTLGDWHNNAPRILTNWQTVNLSPLEGATELRFSFYTTIAGDDSIFGFYTPAYFAFDDLVYEIEEEIEGRNRRIRGNRRGTGIRRGIRGIR
jgi:hypothetical protein